MNIYMYLRNVFPDLYFATFTFTFLHYWVKKSLFIPIHYHTMTIITHPKKKKYHCLQCAWIGQHDSQQSDSDFLAGYLSNIFHYYYYYFGCSHVTWQSKECALSLRIHRSNHILLDVPVLSSFTVINPFLTFLPCCILYEYMWTSFGVMFVLLYRKYGN